MTDEPTDETASTEPATPAEAGDTAAADAAPDAAPEAAADAPAAEDAGAADAEPAAAAPALREETDLEPAVDMGPAVDPRAEARKTRIILPFLIPISAILVVAFVTFNVSRIFLAASEESTTPAVLIAAGITLSILIGASLIAAFPDIRTSSLVVGLCGIFLVVLLAGSLVLGASSPKTEAAAGYVEPTGPAINTLEIDALPELKFQATKFNVPGGINQIKYVDKGGTHTLVFDANAVPGFQLAVPSGKQAAKVDLTPGKTYTVFCTIPGHRQAGMQADIIVGAAGTTPQPGTKTLTPTTAAPGTPTTAPGTPTTVPSGSQSSTGGT